MEEKRELKPEELEKVVGGYDITSHYYNPPGSCGHNKPLYTCSCKFQTSDPDEYASHIAQNPNHINMRYNR